MLIITGLCPEPTAMPELESPVHAPGALSAPGEFEIGWNGRGTHLMFQRILSLVTVSDKIPTRSACGSSRSSGRLPPISGEGELQYGPESMGTVVGCVSSVCRFSEGSKSVGGCGFMHDGRHDRSGRRCASSSVPKMDLRLTWH